MKINPMDKDLSRAHGRSLSFLVSAMLTSAFFATAPEGIVHAGTVAMPAQAIQTLISNIQDSGWHGVSTTEVPAVAATPRAVAVNVPLAVFLPLSDTQLVKIVGAADKSEKFKIVVPELAALLGLPTNQTNTFKFYVFRTGDGIFHVFARLNMRNDYLVLKRTTNILTYLHMDADLQLVAAVTETVNIPHPYKVLPMDEAAQLLKDELTLWADHADTSLPKMPETAGN